MDRVRCPCNAWGVAPAADDLAAVLGEADVAHGLRVPHVCAHAPVPGMERSEPPLRSPG